MLSQRILHMHQSNGRGIPSVRCVITSTVTMGAAEDFTVSGHRAMTIWGTTARILIEYGRTMAMQDVLLMVD